jgi:hypothetical protein
MFLFRGKGSRPGSIEETASIIEALGATTSNLPHIVLQAAAKQITPPQINTHRQL